MSESHLLAPTLSNERISSLDITRGVALLGILLMNITGMGLYHAYSIPTITGGSTGLNYWAWWINSMFFEGTMRGLFSMLFGAGIVLFTSRSVGTINGVTVTDAYFRRLLWLFLFGFIHAYLLLWHGEVLFPYSIVGMFVFSFRNWNPRPLIIMTIVLLALTAVLNIKDYCETKNLYDTATEAELKKKSGKEITKAESKAIESWKGKLMDANPSQEKIDADIAIHHQGYFSNVMSKAPINQIMETTVLYRHFFLEMCAMMLLGMAMLKDGVLKATRSNTYYAVLGLVGYGIGLTTNYFETTYLTDHHYDVLSQSLTNISYDLGRVTTTMGHISVIMLCIRLGILKFLQRALAAVGQMAFTNYIMHTVITSTIFLGFGFSMYGMLQRYQLYYIVFAIWLFQLIVSPIWLYYFRFGPLEWLWRSLTYWQKQPFKR